jgi:hypothetical protein
MKDGERKRIFAATLCNPTICGAGGGGRGRK